MHVAHRETGPLGQEQPKDFFCSSLLPPSEALSFLTDIRHPVVLPWALNVSSRPIHPMELAVPHQREVAVCSETLWHPASGTSIRSASCEAGSRG